MRLTADDLDERVALGVSEVASILGLGRRTVERAVAAGVLASFRFRGRRLVPVAAVRELLAEAQRTVGES
jgi:excisionase family DNA binding protein